MHLPRLWSQERPAGPWGGYWAHVAGGRDAGVAELRLASRLRARVLRLEELRPRDAVSYGRNYVVGPDRAEVHPNTVAARTGRSVYDILMHLSPELPKAVDAS